ncbi:unnamed protein product [Parnassius apollo]|uniref:(apollo) hypothetical protein n=1 Tax=Parnassius apollo TaxID=110799 RepID=A0A8S3XK73_PARAO|nr:unnamed protein product [Parnassius apollo]
MLINIEKYAKLIYPANKENLIKLERNRVVNSYINRNNLVAVLDIPLIERDIYTHYKIISIPISNSDVTHIIIPSYPFLLVKRLKYRSAVSPCEEIDDEKFLCPEESFAEYPAETCIEQIMQMKTNYSSCQQHNIRLENLKIQRIFKNYWLLYTTKDLIITEHCPEHIKKYQVKGTYIIIPNQECRTKVVDTFINTPRYFANIKLQLPTIEMPTVREDDIKKEAKS